MMDYALWEVIENGATLPHTQVVEGVKTMMPITYVEDKAQRKLEEDVNQKLLKSLSPKWNTHAMVWRNKTNLDTMSIDDLYNNLKVYEPEVKGMSSSNSSTQNMAFVSSSNNNSTNGAVNIAQAVNTALGVSTSGLKDGFKIADGHVDNEGQKVLKENKKEADCQPKVVVNAVKGNYVNAVKASACWVSKPKTIVIDHVSKHNNASITLKKFNYVDAQGRSNGCLRHMIGNMSYLTDYEEIDDGYVSFGGKFDGKADEGFFVGYLLSSKAFRVFNSRTRIVEEDLHIRFSENIPNVVGSGPNWLFDIDALTRTMNYEPIAAGTESNGFVCTKACDNADPKSSQDDGFQPLSDIGKKVDEDPSKGIECRDQEQDHNVNSTNKVNAASTNRVNVVRKNISNELPFDPNMPTLEDIDTFNFSSDHEDDDEEADMNNIDTTIQFSLIPTTRIHKDHPLDQEPKKVIHALKDPSWIEAMQEELLQLKLQEVWTLVDLPNGKRAIDTKWVFQNKKDERGIVIRCKARLVAQGHTQEKGSDYDEIFAPVVRIEAIRLFLAYASFKDFVVYQMDVKSSFLYGKIEEEVYVCQPPGFKDPEFLDKVYKVEKALYGLHR
nr:putative ribonuclease H-like domain-containing protein [Tanacetum cinerariifolium]GEX80926.1 putative ribonuclease H-like domain-containing protein [Tanacetum cinerariifolium]